MPRLARANTWIAPQAMHRYTVPMGLPSITLRDANPSYEEGVVFARHLDEPAPPAQEAQARPATKELGYVPLELTPN